MAYRPRRRVASRRSSYAAPARRRGRTSRRPVRRASASARTVRIEVVQVPASAVSRPDMFGMKPGPAPFKRRF